MSVLIMFGFPVTFTLSGVAMFFGVIGFEWNFFNLLPLRVRGRMGAVFRSRLPSTDRRKMTLKG